MTPEQGQAVAKRMGATYVECSSKETQGVDEVFERAVNTAVGQEIERQKERENQQRIMATSPNGFGGKAKKSKRKDCVIL